MDLFESRCKRFVWICTPFDIFSFILANENPLQFIRYFLDKNATIFNLIHDSVHFLVKEV